MAGTQSTKPTKPAKKSSARPAAGKAASPRKTAPKQPARKSAKPVLLSGGNPQIAKGDGDAPVQAYIAAMPGWKRDVGRRLDALITRTRPRRAQGREVELAVLRSVEDEGWFLSFHCYTEYVKVAFFRGASLRPPPPGASKQNDVRYLDIREARPVRRSPVRPLGEAGKPNCPASACDVRARSERGAARGGRKRLCPFDQRLREQLRILAVHRVAHLRKREVASPARPPSR